MEYFIAFLEGIITFISPCLLPMLPIYITYFAGGKERSRSKTLVGALGFVAGFTLIFVAMGALAGTVGAFLTRYQTVVNIVSGIIVVVFGLSFMGLFELPIFRGISKRPEGSGFFASLLFGMVFAVGWTPCVGAFLGSALLLASQQGSALKGTLMLLCYALGLGIPFVLSALLVEYLKGIFGFIKRHYKIVNFVCGSLLVLVGILMASGALGWLLNLLS